jgi:hypothetical protein
MESNDTPQQSPPRLERGDGARKKGVVDVWTLGLVAVFVGAMIYRMVTGC